MNSRTHLLAKIESRCEKITETGCWIWTGSLDRNGYGQIRVGKRPGKLLYTHRVMANAPDDLYALHKCDVPACCNPQHLFLGTQRDNMLDMHKKGRKHKKYPKNENHGRTKVPNATILEIRSASGTYASIAAKYGVSKSLVEKVKHGTYRSDLYEFA